MGHLKRRVVLASVDRSALERSQSSTAAFSFSANGPTYSEQIVPRRAAIRTLLRAAGLGPGTQATRVNSYSTRRARQSANRLRAGRPRTTSGLTKPTEAGVARDPMLDDCAGRSAHGPAHIIHRLVCRTPLLAASTPSHAPASSTDRWYACGGQHAIWRRIRVGSGHAILRW
jgi:hypothetical protein